jgi:hypothetical protein
MNSSRPINKNSKRSNWYIHENPDNTHKAAEKLRDALIAKDNKSVSDILKMPGNVRSFIVRFGKNGEYIKLLRQAFMLLLASGNAKANISEEKITDLMEKNNFNLFLLAEMMAVAFHLRDQDLFYKLFLYLEKRKNSIGRSESYLFALNAFASWEGSVDHNHEKNLKLNKMVLALARENDLKIMEQKAKFALSDHKAYKKEKPLKPGLRIKDFKDMAAVFRNYGIEYDALRADMEYLDSLNNLIVKTADQEQKIDLINAALKEGKTILSALKRIEYPKALIRLKQVLAKTYNNAGNKKMSLKLNKEALILEKKYNILEN